MDQIDGALARFTAERKEEEAFERDLEDGLAERRTYTVDRVMAHTKALMLIRDLNDAADVLEVCLEMAECNAIRIRHSSLALRDWVRWIAEDETRVKGKFV